MTIGNSVVSIGDYAFSECSKVTSLVLGNSVEEIGGSTFYRCTGLTSVVIPNSVTSIGRYAFSKCINLDAIVMGYGIKIISKGAFDSCKASDLYVTAPTPPQINPDTFSEYSGKLHLQGRDAVNEYKTADVWKNFSTELMIEPTDLKIELESSVSGDADGVFRLNAIMEPENVTLPYVFWRSTNPKLASVDNNGLVTLHPFDAGDNNVGCNVIAESLYFDGPIAEVMVDKNGVSIPEIELSKASMDLIVGQSAILTATVKNVIDNTVTWTSSDESVASVDSDGKVTAVAVGEAVITATCGSVSATCNVTVLPILAESITLSQERWSAHAGETVNLTATVLPENATDKTVAWTSSDESVASVDSDGKVTAVAVGEAVITATCGSVSATCNVTVLPVLAESLTIDPREWSGLEGSEFTIMTTVLPEATTDKTLKFESSDTSIATVDTEGNVKVLKEGSCVIIVSTVDGSNLMAECVVTGLSGVEAIFSDSNTQVDVYDMNGILLKKGCTREELKQLTPAVYILRCGDTVMKTVVR